MAEYTYPLSKERTREILEEMMKPQPPQSYTMYMNGKMIKHIYGEHMDVDENCSYLITLDWPDIKTPAKKKKRKKRK